MELKIVLPETLADWFCDYGGNIVAGIVAAARVAGYDGSARRLITITEAIHIAASDGLDIRRNVVTTACQRGVIDGRKSGGTWLVDYVSFRQWLAGYTPASIAEK